MLIKDSCILSEEVQEGQVFGIVYTYNASDPKERESSAQFMLDITYPTEPLRLALAAASEKLTGSRAQGCFVFEGGYGTGKSHALLALYHILNSPKEGREWLRHWKVRLTFPKGTRALISHVLDEGPELLWEPIFVRAGATHLLGQVGDYPKRAVIDELVGEQPLVILLDEIETWYEGIVDESRKARSLAFLQLLSEAASKPGSTLLLGTSSLGRSRDVRSVLNRVNPFRQDLSISQEKDRIVHFRLLEKVNGRAAQGTITRYINVYRKAQAQLASVLAPLEDYRERMRSYYPLHPELVDVAFDGYGRSRNYQNTRGVLYLFAAALRKKAEQRDLLLVSDIDPEDPEIQADLLQLDPVILERCVSDIRRAGRVELSKEVLTTVLMHSFKPEESRGASEADVVLGTLTPERNINTITGSLGQLHDDVAYYLWPRNGRYVIGEKERIPVVVNTRAQMRLAEEGDEEAINRLREVILDTIGGDDVYVLPYDQVPDNRGFKIVASVKHLSDEELRDFYFDREWRNVIALVTPRGGDISLDKDVVIKAMRLLVCDELRGEVDEATKADLAEYRKRQADDLRIILDQRFGWWQKPVGAGKEIEFRSIECELNRQAIDTVLQREYDTDTLRQAILEDLQSVGAEGKRISDIYSDFLKLLGKPIVVERIRFDEAIKSLCRDGEVFAIRGRRWYDSVNPLPEAFDEAVLRLIEYDRRERPGMQPSEEETEQLVTSVEYAPTAEPVVGVISEAQVMALETRDVATPFALQGEVEARLRSTDRVQSITVTVTGAELREAENLGDLLRHLAEIGAENLTLRLVWRFRTPASKEEAIRALDKLPIPVEGSLRAELEVERLESED